MRIIPWVFAGLLPASTVVAQPAVPAETRQAAQKALTLLESSTRTWMKNGKCFTCHHQGLMFRVARTARERGLPLDEALLQQNALRTLAYIGTLDGVIQGLDFIDPALVQGLELVAAHDVGVPPNVTYAAMARRIARLQSPAGNWITTDRRPPQAASNFTATAIALQAIEHHLPARLADLKHDVYRRAREWLLTATPRDTQDRTMALVALKVAGAPADAIKARAEGLVALQRPDGGWAQLPTRDSDAYATGQVLVSLLESGAIAAGDRPYQRGLRYLIDSQRPDGSWFVVSRIHHQLPLNPPDFDMGFPYGHDKIISFLGTGWATVALASALDRAPAVRVDTAAFAPLLPSTDPPPWVETALFGSAGELRALLDGGLDPNAKTDGGTPLLLVAALDDEKVRLLIARGAAVNVESRNRFTALMVAANHTGGAAVVRTLLAHGAQVRSGVPRVNVPTAVHLSTTTGDLDTARLLIEQGDDVRQMWLRFGVQKYTPLQNAVNIRNPELVRLLAGAGADVNERTNNRSATLLSLAVLSNAPDVVTTLLELGAKVNAADELGMTPLLYAAMTDLGDTTVASRLVAAGADREARSGDGLTAEEAARKFGYAELVALLKGPRAAGQ